MMTRQLDCNGREINVFDAIRLIKLPSYVLADADTDELKNIYLEYVSCYGLVKYSRYPNNDGWREWTSENGMILVEVIKITEEVGTVYEFVVPTDCVEVIPYNVLITSLFCNYDWQIHWITENKKVGVPDRVPLEQTRFPIRAGTELHRRLKLIVDTPYEQLVAAHDAVVRIIPGLEPDTN